MTLSSWETLTAEEREAMAGGIVRGAPLGSPWHLEVHPTNQCNVSCFFCVNDLYKPCSRVMLPWERLAGLLRELAAKNLKMLRLSGGGEPLLYPSIRPLLGLMRELGLRLADVNTNGTLLKPLARELVAVGADQIAVSLNEPSASAYAATMRVGEKVFHQVLDGIEALHAALDAAPGLPRPRLRVQFFLRRGNWRELPRMVALGRELRADMIFIRSLIERPAEERITPEERPEVEALLREVIAADAATGEARLAFDLSHEAGLNAFADAEQRRVGALSAAGQPDFSWPQPRREFCFMPWYSAVIGVEGDVYPCCLLMDRPLGNVLRQSWDEIWNGEPYRHLRGEVRRLMRVGDGATHSPRVYHCLKPQCLHRYGCQWTYHLATPGFYEMVRERVSGEDGTAARFLARGEDRALRWAKQIKARLR